jgi:alanine racemase
VAAAQAGARAAGRPLRIHWKLDTGMGRLGTPPARLGPVLSALRAAHSELEVVGVFTHFAAADHASTDFTLAQHERFLTCVSRVRESFPDVLLHAANSAALLRLPETHHDIVRAGLAVYGYAPDHCAGVVALHPALRVFALVTQVKDVRAGESVGYGREWFATGPARVASVAAGYADGVDRRNGNRGRVIIGGTACPIVGRVSMDQLSVDVSAVGEVQPGDVATIIGGDGAAGIDAAEIAAAIGTIPNEVLCAVSSRVPRLVVNQQEVPA